MIGILYIALSWVSGYILLRQFLPSIFDFSKSLSLTGKQVKLPAWMVTLPASFLVGTLLVTWTTYISAYLFRSTGNPMLYGNIISFIFYSILIIFFLVKDRKDFTALLKSIIPAFKKGTFLKNNIVEIIYVLVFLGVWTYLMIESFYIKDGVIKIGLSVVSDFSPHLAVIRSFSFGSNFPSEYPHFADGSMRYHFMYLFLVGNLEFLGLRLDWAFNLPSILSVVSFLMLLYSFTVLLFGEKAIGAITGVLFFFRSSFAFFTYITEKPSVKEAFEGLKTITDHIGNTQNEEWGLYAQKVYVNQRHLSFVLGIMMLVLITVLPLFIEMMTRISELYQKRSQKVFDNEETEKLNENEAINIEEAGIEEAGIKEAGIEEVGIKEASIEEAGIEEAGIEEANIKEASIEEVNIEEANETDKNQETEKTDKKEKTKGFWTLYIKEFIAGKSAWVPQSIVTSVITGIILGLTGFWNGAVVIAALLILFVMAIFSKQRLHYLIIALITIALSYAQTLFFVRSGGSVVSPTIYIGFLANTNGLQQDLSQYFTYHGFVATLQHLFKLIPPVAGFYIELLGIYLFIIVLCLFSGKSRYKYQINWLFSVVSMVIGYYFTKYKLENDTLIINKEVFFVSMMLVFLVLILAGIAYTLYNDSSVPRGTRILILAFGAPIILATTVKMTTTVDVNHKYVVIGYILLNIFVAAFIYRIFKVKKPFAVFAAVAVSIAVTITGFVDIITLHNLNNITVDVRCDDPLLVKIKNETGKNEIFLSDDLHLHPILLAGRKIYCGWPYFTWGAGYDWGLRNEIRKEIFTATDESTLRELVKENNISYIVIDNGVRNSESYTVNEELIRNTFEVFYDDGYDIVIYKIN